MLIIAAFQQTMELEHALMRLEDSGIKRSALLVVPMDEQNKAGWNYLKERDSKTGAFEVAMACATAFAVVGVSRGFILQWGPIIWGLLAGIAGFVFGLLLYQLLWKKKDKSSGQRNKQLPEMTLLIRCAENRRLDVVELLWSHQALTVGIVNIDAGAAGRNSAPENVSGACLTADA